MPFFTPTNTTEELYHTSCQLFDELWNGSPIRLLGIRTAKLLPQDTPIQMSWFDFSPASDPALPADTPADADKLRQLDAAIDSIREKYGSHAIVRGTFLDAPDEYHPKAPRKPAE